MDNLQTAVQDYLRLRRALGFQLNDPERYLRQFVSFLESRQVSTLTAALAVEWATSKRSVQPAHQAARLRAVRSFAKYYSGIEPNTEIPSVGVIPHRPQRAIPYIYSPEEVTTILQTAAGLSHRSELSRQTVVTVLAILSVTGMRIGEVMALNQDDVDFCDANLYINRTKFGKSRIVPVQRSTAMALAEYGELRDKVLGRRRTSNAFFATGEGRRAIQHTIRHAFVRITKQIGIRGSDAPTGPRLHDFRHTFAVQTLIRWYRQGLDAEREFPKLSTYLGHRHWSDTYWYLTAVPELMALATRRLERAFGGLA